MSRCYRLRTLPGALACPGEVRARGIFGGESAQDNSVGVRLLMDISVVFSERNSERVFTADLLAGLCDLDPQWLEFSYGKPLSAASMARVLNGFGISPRKIRIEDRTASGYFRDWFSDAWARYMPRKPEQVEQGSNYAGTKQLSGTEQTPDVPVGQARESTVDVGLFRLFHFGAGGSLLSASVISTERIPSGGSPLRGATIGFVQVPSEYCRLGATRSSGEDAHTQRTRPGISLSADCFCLNCLPNMLGYDL